MYETNYTRVEDKYELTDLTGKTQAEIETLFTDVDITCHL